MKLKEWLKTNRYSQTAFRDMLEPKPTLSSLSQLVNGKQTPSIARAVEIQRLTKGKVKPEDWIRE